MTRLDTDQILLQAQLDDATSPLWPMACAAALAAWPEAQLRRMAWSPAAGDAYAYLVLPQRRQLAAADLTPVQTALAAALPTGTAPCVSRLELAFEMAGASQGADAAWHYVVEMDPAVGWQDELMRWYDTEHMPGLASVPGTVHAARLLNHDHGPLSLACYDLVSPETLGSPPWLAVRGTAWSSRVRSHFTNTRRTMFTILA